MISNLSLHPELFENTLNLIERSLGYCPEEKFRVDFYPLIESSNNAHNYIMLENGKVIGHIGVKIRFWGNNENFLKVALIGAVVTDEPYRKKGIASRLFAKILSDFQDVGLFILWGEQNSLYQKLFFHPAGIIFESLPNRNSDYTKGFIKTKLANISPKELGEIKTIYNNFSLKNFISFLRSDADWDSLKQITSVDLFILKDGKNGIVAYFCQNKGMDLKGIIHEFGFSPGREQDIFELISSAKVWSPIISPKIPHNIWFQALFRMGNLNLFNLFLQHETHNSLKVLYWNTHLVKILFKDEIYLLNQESFFQNIFGPYPMKPFSNVLSPLLVSGLDSV